MLYKVNKTLLNTVLKVLIITKKKLTFSGSYDMLIMLGRL